MDCGAISPVLSATPVSRTLGASSKILRSSPKLKYTSHNWWIAFSRATSKDENQVWRQKYFARYATTVLKLCASPLTLAKLDWAETFLGFDEPVFELKNKSMTILVDIAQKHIEAVNRIYDKVYETDSWILFSNIYTSILLSF